MEKKSKGKDLRKLADPQRNYIKEVGINSLNMEGIPVWDKIG